MADGVELVESTVIMSLLHSHFTSGLVGLWGVGNFHKVTKDVRISKLWLCDFLSWTGTPISELAKVYPKVNITKDPKGKMKSISIELKHVINSMI